MRRIFRLPQGTSTPANAAKAIVVARRATAATDEISLLAAKYRISFANKRQSYASATGRLLAYFFLRRAFLPMRPLRAVSALSIANSSSLRPCWISAASHRGRAPRPAQVSPPGPRYLGALSAQSRGQIRFEKYREHGRFQRSAEKVAFPSSLRF